MMAALFSAENGASVCLLEKNEKLGKKVYITGKGRCNLTNTADSEQFMTHILRNPRFMYRALARLDNRDTMELFERLGVPLKVERGGRVFPVSDKAGDINDALRKRIAALGVEVRLHSTVRSLRIADGRCAGVELADGVFLPADAVVVATGGLSYPSTGSTGDGYRLAEEAGHRVTERLASLVPLETRESWPGMLTGLSLKNVRLTAFAEGKGKRRQIYSEQGEMLFTHFGISGPLVLTLSALLPADEAGVALSIDLKPALDERTLDARLVRDLRELSRKQLQSVMDGLVPHALGQQLLVLAGIPAGMPSHSVTAVQRRQLVTLLKNLPLTVSARRGYAEAIVTRGGVDVRGIDPATMESRLVRGLYFAGEVLDVDATTGGFNLQIAFSTGALAGTSAAGGEGTA